MARGILRRLSALPACLALFSCAALADATPNCTGAAPEAIAPLAQAAAESPLNRQLQKTYGSATSCRVRATEGKRTLEIAYPHGGRFEMDTDGRLEYVRQSARFAGGKTSPDAKTGLANLREYERSAAAPDGCGVDWRPMRRAAGTGKWEAEGTSCNCKATMELKGGKVRLLAFGLAC